MRQEKTRDLGFFWGVWPAWTATLGRLDPPDPPSMHHGGIRARGAPSREVEEGKGCDEAGGVRWRLLPWKAIWRPTPDALQSRTKHGGNVDISVTTREVLAQKLASRRPLPSGFYAHARQKSMRRFSHTCAVCTQRERKARSRSAAASAAAAAAASSRCHSVCEPSPRERGESSAEQCPGAL